eukprot:TRINITY_DN11561_c0_g1_i1.p1 TRINITY_DN11561_c0_g1~~TRINITY_DN11561_c0_g1_i1.p1  ORF type:complete len:454 (+),score=92.85 TRINITY_DN11561_c0_g1_i1:63-1424(+)
MSMSESLLAAAVQGCAKTASLLQASSTVVAKGNASDPTTDQQLGVASVEFHLSDTQARIVMGAILFFLILATVLLCLYSCRTTSLKELTVSNPLSYDMRGLLSWMTLTVYNHTVWENDALWVMTRRLAALSAFTTAMQLLMSSDASALDPVQFADLNSFCLVFVSLLLSFFLANAMNRWFTCVNGYLAFFQSLRELHMQLHALGVKESDVQRVMRYGLSSIYILTKRLQAGQGSSALEIMEKISEFDEKNPLLCVTKEEVEALKDCQSPSSQLFTMAGNFIGHLAQEGQVPPMASPTYGRIMQLVGKAHDEMKSIWEIQVICVPFVYVHTLAFLVHVQNILCAISLGFTLACCLASALAHIDTRLTVYGNTAHPDHNEQADAQHVTIQTLKCFVLPVLLQAFLEVGFDISSPFQGSHACIPAYDMLVRAQRDLIDGDKISSNPIGYEKPSFKK